MYCLMFSEMIYKASIFWQKGHIKLHFLYKFKDEQQFKRL